MNGKWKAILLAVLMLSCGLAAAEPEPMETAAPVVPVIELPALEEGEIIEIPVDQNMQKHPIPPEEGNYLYDGDTEEATGYADPSITVNIGRGRIYETDYVYARVRIANASQIRTLMASPLGNLNTTPAHDLAKRVKAVVAINGDYPGGDKRTKRTKGAVMRQGKMLRLKCDQKYDVLVIDKKGDMHILVNAKDEDVEPYKDEAVNIFTFGPALVIDGKPNYGFDHELNVGPNRPAQRMAICQTGPLEYLMITSEGPENKGSVGLTIDQLISLISSIPDVKTAYNLDGGSSSAIVFRRDGKNWRKINATSSPKVQQLKDIIYFSSAWEHEAQPAE